jgi:hypothetical protein
VIESGRFLTGVSSDSTAIPGKEERIMLWFECDDPNNECVTDRNTELAHIHWLRHLTLAPQQ